MRRREKRIKAGIGWLIAAAGLIFACQLTANPATPTPIVETEVVEVTRLVEVIVTVAVPILDAAAGANGTDGLAQTTPDITPTPPPTITPQPTHTPGPTRPPINNSTYNNQNLELLAEAWRVVQEEYDGPVPEDADLTYALIEAALATLGDDYTVFADPATVAREQEIIEGSFEGIGAIVNLNDNNQFEIVRPYAGQPAALAGLLPGDIILAVDGISVAGMSIDESVALVRGPAGTSVTLTVERAGVAEPFDITIVRGFITIPIIEAEMLPDNIAYVRLTTFFNLQTSSQLEITLVSLLAQEPRAIILDLRDNGGGFLIEAIEVADLFLPEGDVMFERNIRGLEVTYTSEDGDLAEEIPLVVLVNAGSASASEIVAGAIQDRDRAIVIGETTFGKGSVQGTYNLSDGSQLRVTIARWYTPDDHTIDGQGIAPNIEELPSPLSFGGPDDNQLQRAIDFILKGE